MSGEIELDVMLLRQLIKLYKAMVTSGDKYIIHQKTMCNGIVMIEWCLKAGNVCDQVFLHPNEIYKKNR